ncbi:MAG: hypothetical protein ACPG4S_08265, partial [Schleiferiaceae bacterium]
MTKSQVIRTEIARKKQAKLDLENIIRKYESTLLKIAKRNDTESIPGCTFDDSSFNKTRHVPHTQPQTDTANNSPVGDSEVDKPCTPTTTAINSPAIHSGVNKPCMQDNNKNHIHMVDIKQPFGFVKTTCNCRTPEKIPKVNDVIRSSDTDNLVSKQECDVISTDI